VRLKMAELQLDQITVAGSLAIDRANLSRRLAGMVAERPSRAQVECLAQLFEMDAASRIDLLRLAGYAPGAVVERADDDEPAATSSATQRDSPALDPSTLPEGIPHPSRSKTSLRRRWSLRHVALAVTATLVALAGSAVLIARLAPGVQEPVARIASPADGSLHPLGWVDVSGSARAPAPDMEHLWIVEGLAGYYWPQQQAVIYRDSWSARARLGAGPEDLGKQLDLFLVLAPAAADQEFRAWLEQGAATGDYPPMRSLPATARVLDRVAVTIVAN
jgi:hypothetical protein